MRPRDSQAILLNVSLCCFCGLVLFTNPKSGVKVITAQRRLIVRRLTHTHVRRKLKELKHALSFHVSRMQHFFPTLKGMLTDTQIAKKIIFNLDVQIIMT